MAYPNGCIEKDDFKMNMTYRTQRKTHLNKNSGLDQVVTNENDTSQYDGIPNSMLNSILAERMTGLKSQRVDIGKSMHQKIENHYGVSMPGLEVYKDEGLNEAGAHGYAKGNEIHIAAENMNLNSQVGQSLLLHEAGHVVQQGAGLASGSGFLYDNALESNADMGFAAPQNFVMPTSNAGPVQGGLMDWLKKLFSKGGGKPSSKTIPQTVPQPITQPEQPPAKTLQEEKDYLYGDSGGYRTGAGEAKQIPLMAAQGVKVTSPLIGSFSGKTDKMDEKGLMDFTNEYMSNLTEQLDTPESTEFFSSLGNTMGGSQYDSLKQTNSVDDVSMQLMSQLPTRAFSPMKAMTLENYKNTNILENVKGMNNYFGKLHLAYSEKKKNKGVLTDEYKEYAPMMEKYEELRSKTLSKALPHLRDETIDKLTPEEKEIARPGGVAPPTQVTQPKPEIVAPTQVTQSDSGGVAPPTLSLQPKIAPNKNQTPLQKRFYERNVLEQKLTGDLIKMHNVPTGGRANGIDPRQTMHIMHILNDGKEYKGDELNEFLSVLGGSDMEKKKPILDKFFKNVHKDILKFDKGMFDEENIVKNIEWVQNFAGTSLAYDNMKGQREFGYEADEEMLKEIDSTDKFSAHYSSYATAMLGAKHGLIKDQRFKPLPLDVIDFMKGNATKEYGAVKDVQKKNKKPFWKFW
jgi:hypothetical protein